jgi:hypothetical protein
LNFKRLNYIFQISFKTLYLDVYLYRNTMYMDHQNLIIYMIKQDLRQMQLLKQLQKVGMDVEPHYSDIMTVVGRMMGLAEKGISDQFSGLYNSFMEEADKYEMNGTGSHLTILASKCYHTLKSCIEIEKRSGEYYSSE